MNPEDFWSKIKKLEGKRITTISGKIFYIYKVTDDRVYFDPEETKNPGSHYLYKKLIVGLSVEITNKISEPDRRWRINNLKEVCENERISKDVRNDLRKENQNYSYIMPILCAIGVLQHETAGKVVLRPK